MDQFSEHVNSSNHKIYSRDQMRKNIVNLGSKKYKKNSAFQLNHLQNHLLLSIFDTPENDLTRVDRKSDMRKVRVYLINSSSILFFCSIRAMYDRVNIAQNKILVSKSYIPGVNT